jgi:GT2 family glycosyltransferase
MQSQSTLPTGPGEPGLVSVVIPSYNRAHLIGETIESVLAQTYRPVEIIVVDDGSRDDTRAVVQRYGPEVRYLYQSNAGVSAARNTGLAAARGEFIALLDSDDIWLPWKLAAQVALLRRYADVGMVWTDMRAIDEGGYLLHDRYLREFYATYRTVRIEDVCEHAGSLGDAWEDAPADVAAAPFYMGDIFSPMILGNLVHTSTVLLRRERVGVTGGFDTTLQPAGEDYEYHLRTCSHGPVGLLDTASIDYRIGAADQITAPHYDIHFARSNLRTVERWLERGGTRVTLSAAALAGRMAHAHGWVGMAEMDEGNMGVARRHLWASLRHRVQQPRVLLYLLLSLFPAQVFSGARQLRRDVRASLRGRLARARAATLAPALHFWSEALLDGLLFAL